MPDLHAPAKLLDVDSLVLEHLVVEEESLQLAQAMRRYLDDVVILDVIAVMPRVHRASV